MCFILLTNRVDSARSKCCRSATVHFLFCINILYSTKNCSSSPLHQKGFFTVRGLTPLAAFYHFSFSFCYQILHTVWRLKICHRFLQTVYSNRKCTLCRTAQHHKAAWVSTVASKHKYSPVSFNEALGCLYKFFLMTVFSNSLG